MDKLNFLTAGIPLKAKDYKTGFNTLRELNLDGMELEFVHGVRISDVSKQFIKENKNELILTAHAPFYVNLNSKEEEKIEASIQRIIETINMANELGAYSITYHAAFYMGQEKDIVYKKVIEGHNKIFDGIKNNSVWVRPETTGKKTQWGDVDEVINLSLEFEKVLPCIDFSHLHARENGEYNTYKEFAEVFEKIGNKLGKNALENFHAHIAGIEYTPKGEKQHLNLLESDFNYRDLLKAFKDFEVKGVVVCESPNIEEDCKLLKDYYESL